MIKIKIIASVNIIAALFFITNLPNMEGGRLLGGSVLALFHLIMAIGFLIPATWARSLMLIYATFQLFALITANVVSVLSLQYQPFSTWGITLLAMLFTLGPLLIWILIFLLKENTKFLFK